MNVVHIFWNSYLFGDKTIYKDKGGYTTIIFQNISSRRKQILNASKSYPQICNDRQIVKVDDFPEKFHNNNHCMNK